MSSFWSLQRAGKKAPHMYITPKKYMFCHKPYNVQIDCLVSYEKLAVVKRYLWAGTDLIVLHCHRSIWQLFYFLPTPRQNFHASKILLLTHFVVGHLIISRPILTPHSRFTLSFACAVVFYTLFGLGMPWLFPLEGHDWVSMLTSD